MTGRWQWERGRVRRGGSNHAREAPPCRRPSYSRGGGGGGGGNYLARKPGGSYHSPVARSRDSAHNESLNSKWSRRERNSCARPPSAIPPIFPPRGDDGPPPRPAPRRMANFLRYEPHGEFW